MKISKIFIICSILSSGLLFAKETGFKLKEFETDGCTMFADGTSENPTLWKHCCVAHDLRYWFGGENSQMDYSDIKLRECVKEAANEKWANLIYLGVRAGHHSPVKNKYAWNWGWTPKRALIPFTPIEELYIKKQLQKIHLEAVNMDEFLKTYFPSKE